MKNPARKYVDLILAASGKWAHWNPPDKLKVGDYGTVDKETGQFQKDGNIYKEVTTASLAALHPPHSGTPENTIVISSRGVKHRDLILGAEVNATGIAEASIKGQWKFGTKRGALLIIARPRSTYVPPKVLLKLLVDVPALQDKLLVTEVVSCPAYSLYLSSANNDILDVALLGSLPVPVAPAVAAGGKIGASWWSQGASGLFRDACDPSGSLSYTPLCTLKKIRRKGLVRRESPVPDPEDDDLWVDAQEPWSTLDDDGEEEVYEDTYFD